MDPQDMPDDVALLSVDARDLMMLRSAIREASEALEDWEFETRTGCTRAEFLELAARLREVEISLARPPA